MALLVILMYADGDTAWIPVEGFVTAELFDPLLATTIKTDQLGGTGDVATKMQMMIAYSAIDEGILVFGDTGIASLLSDADDFGYMEISSNTSLAAY